MSAVLNNMTILVVLCAVLSMVPVLSALLFRRYLVARKQEELEDEIRKLNGQQSELVQSRGGLEQVAALIKSHYRWRSLLLPAVICAGLYLIGFVLCLDYIHINDRQTTSFLFPGIVLSHVRLLLYTFIGVYLFNSGTLIRRVYLLDLSERVFWGAIYRMLLSMGVAIAMLPLSLSGNGQERVQRQELVFFAVGFMATAFLDKLLEKAVELVGIKRDTREDFSLRMVRGINIWKDYRLEEEGIENAQNLATADVIELAVKTHYPLRTLIDWVDQAMVVSRFGLKTKDLEAAGFNVSAIEMAWLAPEATGDTAFAKAIAAAGKLDFELVKAQLNSLYEDAFVRELWTLWQTKPEFKDAATFRIPLAVPPPHGAPVQQQAPQEKAGD